MPNEIVIPRLGWSMDEGTFVRWLKDDGELVIAGEPLFELESDKAVEEIPAIDRGILSIPQNAPQPGSVVAVGTVLGYLLAEGESAPVVSEKVATKTEGAKTESARTEGARLEIAKTDAAGDESTSSLRVPRLSSAESIRRPTDVKRVDKELQKSNTARRNVATPRARRTAAQMGVDVTQLSGTGRDGRIREQDVRQFTADATQLADADARRNEPLSPRRRTIAQRMLTSQQATAHVTLCSRVDAGQLVSLRDQFKASDQALLPSYTDIAVKLIASALQRHPMLAAKWQQEKITYADGMHVGIAVDTDEGLLVPVIRHVTSLTLRQVTKRSKELVERARTRRLTHSDGQGGVITITNLGGLGIDVFTPIIHDGQTAILGMGAIRREAVVLDDDRIEPRWQMTLSLTFDHRIVDGAPAARFLQTLCQGFANPAAWLLMDDA